MARFEPGQLIVLARPLRGSVPILILSASLCADKKTWTVEFLRRGEVVKAMMWPGSWRLLKDSM